MTSTAGSGRKLSLPTLAGCWAQEKQALTFSGSVRGSDSSPEGYVTMGTAELLSGPELRQDNPSR